MGTAIMRGGETEKQFTEYFTNDGTTSSSDPITNGLIRGGLINALKEAHILEETNLLKIPFLNFLKKLY